MIDDHGQASGKPENEGSSSATPASRAAETDRLAKKDLYLRLATDIASGGCLRRYVPCWPWWCRRIGKDVIYSVTYYGMPDPSEITLLFDAHARAVAERDAEQQACRDIEKWFAWHDAAVSQRGRRSRSKRQE
jgi:hypothetical protein